MRDAVLVELLGAADEAALFVKAPGVALGLDAKARSAQLPARRGNPGADDPLAQALAAPFGYDAAYERRVGVCRALRQDAGAGADAALVAQEDVQRLGIPPVHVEIGAALLDDEDLAAQLQKLIELRIRELGKTLDNKLHNITRAIIPRGGPGLQAFALFKRAPLW